MCVWPPFIDVQTFAGNLTTAPYGVDDGSSATPRETTAMALLAALTAGLVILCAAGVAAAARIAARRGRRKQGHHHGGTAPAGYTLASTGEFLSRKRSYPPRSSL